MSRTAFVLLGLSISAALSAAVLQTVEIEHDSGHYRLVSRSHMNAPRQAIFDVLVDYERFGRISRAYTEFGFLDPTEDGTPVIHTTMEGCILFFCKSLRRVELLEVSEPGFIRTVTLPEQSDFVYSVSEWDLEPEDGGTLVTYRLEFEPDFWVPPVIGPWALKQSLERGGAHAVDRIEWLALEDSMSAQDHP